MLQTPIEKGCLTYIGEHFTVKYFKHIFETHNITLTIGHYSSIAEHVTCFIDGNHRFDHASSFPFYELGFNSDLRNKNGWGKGAPKIGNDVWVGYGVTIMSGVHIHDGCVVAASSVVTKGCPPYSVVAGNPAKVIKYRFPPDMIEAFLRVQWWHLPTQDVLEYLAPLQYDPPAFLEKAQEIRKYYDELKDSGHE